MKTKALLAVCLLLFAVPAFAFFPGIPFFNRASQPVIIVEDVNGQDLNVGLIVANRIDANAVFANYWVARNAIDYNFLDDADFFGNVNVQGDSNFADIGLSGNIYNKEQDDILFIHTPGDNFVALQGNESSDVGYILYDSAVSHFNGIFTAFSADPAGDNFQILTTDGPITLDPTFVLGTPYVRVDADLNVVQDTRLEKNLTVLGDSNFVNIGVSGKSYFFDFVNLHADPVDANQAATKAYVDAIDIRSLVNGTIKEPFNALVTSDGATVTMSLTNAADGNLTLQFSDGDTLFDVNANGSIVLTAGSDSSPTENFIYILQSDKSTLVKSTSSFPDDTEHTTIGYFVVPSAGFVQTDGAYINQNWNDDLSGTDLMGDLTHVGEKLRRLSATYFSGIAGNGTDGYLTPTNNNTEFNSTSGFIYQKHKQAFPAFDTNAGDKVLVKNWSGDSFHDITNLFDITADSTGANIGNNKYFNLVFWGVGNKTNQYAPVLINLPSGFYNTQSAAENDVSGHDDFSIPREFNRESSTGFLIARVTVRMGATWDVISTVDLRGITPTVASGGIGGIVRQFPDNVFRVFDESDISKEIEFVLDFISTATTRKYTFPDRDANLVVSDSFGDVNIPRDLNVAGGIIATADSNFTSLGISQGLFGNFAKFDGNLTALNLDLTGSPSAISSANAIQLWPNADLDDGFNFSIGAGISPTLKAIGGTLFLDADSSIVNVLADTLTTKAISANGTLTMNGSDMTGADDVSANSFTADTLSISAASITDSSGEISFSTTDLLTTGDVGIGKAAEEELTVYRNNNGTDAQIMAEQDAAGDAVIGWQLTAAQTFLIGIDNSGAGNPLVIADAVNLGTNQRLVLDSSGNFDFKAGDLVTTGDVNFTNVNIDGNVFVNNSFAGLTQDISVRKGDDSGACTLNFVNGILIATDC